MPSLIRRSLSLVLFVIIASGSAIGQPRAARSRTISLDGEWSFVTDPAGKLTVSDLASAGNVRSVRVPASWQAQFADLRDYAGVAWYWRAVVVEKLAADQVALLRFGAVDYLAEVYVNGRKVGAHEGGYLPFEFDVTALLRSAENHIAVRVVDAGGKVNEVEDIKYAEIPHGKQSWYVQTSGLWQSVELAIRPRVRLGAVHITAHANGGFKIEVPVVDALQSNKPVRVNAEIRDPAGKILWQGARQLRAGDKRGEFSGSVENAQPWSVTNPTLYTLRVRLSSGDSQALRFGFRTFEIRGGKFYLNGSVIYLRGALDQDFYPDTIYTPPSLDYLRDAMRKGKALGLNLLRCHIKVPDPRYLDAADETGMLVWYEIPNWDRLNTHSQRRAMDTLDGMVARDWNHPSLVIVSIVNESWGVNMKQEAHRQWLKTAYEEAKRIVPGWLVVDNSACCDNFHVATDIADFHTYSAIPDHAAEFDRFVADLARRPAWLFSPHGDAVPRSDEPLVLSEFGNWGLPRTPETQPWWFARDFGGNPLTLPDGVENRFAEYQLDALFPSFDALIEVTQWHQYRALKHEIETLRLHEAIQGYVITEFTDINWEVNGLLDMWRRFKAHEKALAALQQDDLVIVRAPKRNFTTGEKVQGDVYFSHYSAGILPGGEVTWALEGTSEQGKFVFLSVEAGSVVHVGKVEFTAPAVHTPSKRTLHARVTSRGKSVSENFVELFFFPSVLPENLPRVAFHDPGGELQPLVEAMRVRGYLPAASDAPAVLIAATFDEGVKKALQAGAHVILLARNPQTLAPGLEVVLRAHSVLDGNWISGFLWTRSGQEPFKSLGFDTLAGFEVQAAAPTAVVRGIPAKDFGDVLAGFFYGWIHSNVGALVQAEVGTGKLLVCTFSLVGNYGTDPYATYLLDALLRYAVSDFKPSLRIPLAEPYNLSHKHELSHIRQGTALALSKVEGSAVPKNRPKLRGFRP